MESVYKLSFLVSLIDRISGPLDNIRRVAGEAKTQFDKCSKAVGAAKKQFDEHSATMVKMVKDGTLLIDTGYKIANATLAPVKATFETQDALGVLASMGVQDLQMLEESALAFSNTWAGTTKPQFLQAAAAIKSDIDSLSDEAVAGYTRIAGLTAKATQTSIAEMANLFDIGYSIYKDYYSQLSDLEFGEMFSAGIAGATRVFKADGASISQAFSSLGASATMANVPLEEQMSVLGMLMDTMSGSEAGTKYTAFLNSAAQAGKELGLNFTDANGQLRSMPEILGTIRGKFGETMTAADQLELQKAFGTMEAVKLIDLLYGKTDDLQDNILTLYDSMSQGMSITEEMANKVNAPPGQQWEVLKQKMQSTIETIGSSMLPTFIRLQEPADSAATKIAEFAEKYPTLTSNIMYSIMAFGSLLVVLGIGKIALVGLATIFLSITGIGKKLRLAIDGVRYAMLLVQYGAYNARIVLATLGKGFLTMAGSMKTALVGMLVWVKQGIISAMTALPGLIASVWSFTAALLANPITWIVIGIIALIAALVLLWKNWDAVTAWMQSAWQNFIGGIRTAFDWVRNQLAGVSNWVLVAVAAFLPFLGIPMLIIKNWDTIKEFFGNLIQWFREAGARLVQGFAEGLKTFANNPVETMKTALGKLRNLLPFSDAKTGPLSDLTLSGQRIFETMNTGMIRTADLPAETMWDAFEGIDISGGGNPFTLDGSKETPVKQTIIRKLQLNVDMSSIEDLKKLKKLLNEIEDETNSNPAIGLDEEDAA